MKTRAFRLNLTVIAVAILFAMVFSFSYAFADDGNVTNKDQGTSYASLADAVKEAADGETLIVNKDFDEEDGKRASVSKKITIDLAGHKIGVNKAGGSYLTVGGELLIEGRNGGFTGDKANTRAITVDGKLEMRDASVSDFHYSGSGAAIYNSGNVVLKSCRFEGNRSTEAVDKGSHMFSGAGAVCLYYGDGISEIDGCSFIGNSAVESGGALSIYGGEANIRNSVFDGNTSETGGALFVRMVKDVTIEGCQIKNNIADNARYRLQDLDTNGRGTYQTIFTGHGGGLFIFQYGKGQHVTMRNNVISGNHAKMTVGNAYSGRGGGMTIIQYAGAKVDLESGEISGNSAVIGGGGIDYMVLGQDPLKLKEIAIYGNEAVRGAGLWLCQSGTAKVYTTLGGTILGNKASGSSGALYFHSTINAAGDDINNEGPGSDDVINEYGLGRIKVPERALGGVIVDWFWDASDARYSEAAEPRLLTKEEFGDTQAILPMHGEIGEGLMETAVKDAKLVIKNNYAVRGGGIASNSPIEIGVDEEKEISVEKRWADENDKLEKILVDLVRVGSDGTREVIEKNVELSEENSWKHTFTGLPTNYEYDVEEQVPEGYEVASEREASEEGVTVVLTNTKKPEEPPVEEEKKEEEPKKEEVLKAPEKPEGVKQIEGMEGEIVTTDDTYMAEPEPETPEEEVIEGGSKEEEPKYKAEPEEEEEVISGGTSVKAEKNEAPVKTGDNENMILYMVILLQAAAAVGLLIRLRKAK